MRQQSEQKYLALQTQNEYLETPRFQHELKGYTGKLGGSKYHTMVHMTKYSNQIE